MQPISSSTLKWGLKVYTFHYIVILMHFVLSTVTTCFSGRNLYLIESIPECYSHIEMFSNFSDVNSTKQRKHDNFRGILFSMIIRVYSYIYFTELNNV